jgi:hypothetical protein
MRTISVSDSTKQCRPALDYCKYHIHGATLVTRRSKDYPTTHKTASEKSKAVHACTVSRDGSVLHIGTIAVVPRCSDCIGPTVRLELLMREVQHESLHLHMSQTGVSIGRTLVRPYYSAGNGHG